LLLALGYASLSLCWSASPLDSLNWLWRAYLLAAVFFIGSALPSIEKLLRVMSISLSFLLPLVVLQQLGYQGIPQTAPPAGLFINKNLLAEAAALLFVAMVYLRLWWCTVPLALLLLLTQERAAAVGLILALIVFMAPRLKLLPRKALIMSMTMIIGLGMLIALSTYHRANQMTRLDTSSKERLVIWQDTVDGLTVLGRGIGSYYVAFPQKATRLATETMRPEFAHSEPLHFVFELGLGSLLLAALGCYVLRGAHHELERLIMVTFLGISFFAFPLHMPVTAFIAALCAGRLCHGRDDLRNFLTGKRASSSCSN